VDDLVVFALVLVATYWMGGRLPGRADLVERRLPEVPRARNVRTWALVALPVGAVLLTVLPYGPRQALMTSIIGVVLALSLVVITGFVGQVSVVQLALSGACGLVMSQLATKAGIGFPWAPLIAVLATTVLGVLTAIPALRVRGVQLAVVTLATVVAISEFWLANPTWGAVLSGAPIDQPTIFGIDLGNTAGFRGLDGQLPSPVLGWIFLVLAILACLFVANLRRSGLGRRMLAVRSNERAAAAAGIDVARVKVIAVAISSCLAGIAGAMYGYNFGSVSTTRFGAITAFTLIAFAYVGGIAMVSGAVLAAVFATGGMFEYGMINWLGVSGVWLLLLGGLAVLCSVVVRPDGLAGALRRRSQAVARGRPSGAGRVAGMAAESARSR
jgi:branched-chain amino acid transport system permease protein